MKAPDLAFQSVDVLLAYLNRGDLLHDLQETVRQIHQAVSGADTPARSVKTITREGGRKQKLSTANWPSLSAINRLVQS